MDPKNVVVSAFTRLRVKNLERAVTTKIYHRIRNVKNAERSKEKKRGGGGGGGEEEKRKHGGAVARREADARQLRIVEGSRALILNPG